MKYMWICGKYKIWPEAEQRICLTSQVEILSVSCGTSLGSTCIKHDFHVMLPDPGKIRSPGNTQRLHYACTRRTTATFAHRSLLPGGRSYSFIIDFTLGTTESSRLERELVGSSLELDAFFHYWGVDLWLLTFKPATLLSFSALSQLITEAATFTPAHSKTEPWSRP